ncbi:ATP-binding protein [Uliginosibacterium aquaticum]|uniref:ATP-binding protein n=1 Tax=Uliginosibacterium aquaticum TaxID=2731212 RepID=A0ABX2II73_9RHOO|nr:ATP-binding protein [Uliginosibacterium aquaticum]NSL56524.1 ATP-binding protein [Uliginosibacterium aquaticum]
MKKLNPFKPNSPVPPAMFAGRISEIESIEKSLFQTQNGQPSNLMVTGDRGIGKSSLLFYVKGLASGGIKSPDYERFNFVTVDLLVSEKTDISTLVKLAERKISRELSKTEAIRSFLHTTWEFVKRIRIMDSGIGPEEKNSEIEILLDDFSYSLAETSKRITENASAEEKRDGIVFVIDECDSASPDLRLGYFFKNVTESLLHHGCYNVMFIIAGLPTVVEKLSESHPSSIRVFTQVPLGELSPSDRRYVVDRGLEEANKVNKIQTKISPDAKIQISVLSEGYPNFIQQFSFSAFEEDSDNEISGDDVLNSAFKQGGAIDAIGSRYYASDFYDRIKSDEYREVLSIMAEKMNEWITKAEIRAKFSGDESTLSNALSALVGRKIILRNPSKIGEYRLQQRGFALWIKLFGDKSKPKA